jgi:hypothetical protein
MKSNKTAYLVASLSLPAFAALSATAHSAQLSQDASLNRADLNQPLASTMLANRNNSALDAMEVEAFNRDGGSRTCKACNRIVMSADEAANEDVPSALRVIHSQIGS